MLKRFYAIIISVTILLSACGKELPSAGKDADYTESVTTLDVGQAACTLIESGGRFRLIDRGRAGGKTNITAYLNRRGVKEIDLFVISHFHYDHTSEALDVIRNFEIGTVVIPSLSDENIPDTYFYKSVIEDGKNGYYNLEYAQQGKTFPVGNGSMDILADTINTENINNTSIALSYTKGDFVYVNTADIERDGDSMILENLPADITLYTASHHGSRDAGSSETLKKLSPELVIISRGRDNDYGHPHKEYLNRLAELKIPYEITFEKGNIVYDINSGRRFYD